MAERPAWRRVVSQAAGVAMDRGWLPYRRALQLDAGQWDREHQGGTPTYYRRLSEASRYGLLIGFLGALGAAPRILDVGCGEGILRERLAGMPFSEYVGIDISAVAIERAGGSADDRTRFVVSHDLTAHGRFDVVVCNEMLYNVADVPSFLDRVNDVLLPGGHLLTSIFRHRGHRALHRMLDERFDRQEAVMCSSLTWPKSFYVGCHRRRAEITSPG